MLIGSQFKLSQISSDFTVKVNNTPLERVIKGQMNQKIDILSFVALPSPNTKKNHPK